MPLTVPAAPKVRTTRYENFKGVDFTNDATNIWYRRSPSAVNMISDEAGRPFKRTGWAEVVNEDNFREVYVASRHEDFPEYIDFEITMCYYFTLAGDNHIIVFTNVGVFKYVNNELSLIDSDSNHKYEQLFIDSYQRGFFFEGGGTSAFYIYGQPRIVWKYYYDKANDEYKCEITEPTIPSVIVGADAQGAGTMLQPFNLLGGLAYIEYQNNTYDNNNTKRVDLPVNVAQSAIGTEDIQVWTSTTTQFDTELTIHTSDYSDPLVTGECMLHTDNDPDGKAYLTFFDSITEWNGSEDNIRVKYPSTVITFDDNTYDGYSSSEPSDVILERDA